MSTITTRIEAEQFDLFSPPLISTEQPRPSVRYHAHIVSGDIVDPRHTLVVDGTRIAVGGGTTP